MFTHRWVNKGANPRKPFVTGVYLYNDEWEGCCNKLLSTAIAEAQIQTRIG